MSLPSTQEPIAGNKKESARETSTLIMPEKFNDGSIPKGFLNNVLLLPSFY